MESAISTLSDEQLDVRLVERAQAGDHEAFGQMMKRWERRIYAVAYGLLGRDADARDATQETFLAAFRNLKNFRGEAKVSSWLHRIAVNQCITRQRRAKVRNERSLEADSDDDEAIGLGDTLAAADSFSPLGQTEGRERSAAVQRAVTSLPPDLRQVIILKEFEEMTFQEIADTLELPISTVKSRLYTALKQLRLKLQAYQPTV